MSKKPADIAAKLRRDLDPEALAAVADELKGRRTERFAMRLTPAKWRAVNEAAEKAGVSLTRWVEMAIDKELER